MSVLKKSKIYHSQDEWEIEYFFVKVKDKCCLIFNASVSLTRNGNLECHCNAIHCKKYDADFPPKSVIRKLKVKGLITKLAAHKQLMSKSRSLYNNIFIHGQQSNG
jgi:hypothetical protein